MPPADVWLRKTDDEVAAAARRLDDYTEEGKSAILNEVERRRGSSLFDDPSKEGAASETEDPADPSNGLNVVQRMWRGYVSLPMTYWAWGVCGGFSVLIVSAVVATVGGTLLALPFEFIGIAYYVFVQVAIWRSANRYRGKQIWAQLAQVSVAASVARTVVRLLFGA